MKNLYAFLAIVGFITPNVLVSIESFETGNVLLWLDPMTTVNGMFANRIAAAFVLDLLCVVLAALVWMYVESKKTGDEDLLDVRCTRIALRLGRSAAAVSLQA